MQRRQWDTDRLGLRRLDLILVSVALALALSLAVIATDPQFAFALLDRSLYVVVLSLTSLGAISLAGLALARYRESGRLAGLFQSAAFLVLAWAGVVNLTLIVLRAEGRFGLTLGQPEQLPMYVWTMTNIVAAVLFAIGGLAAMGTGLRRQPSVRRTLLLPVIGLSALTAIAWALRDLLPPFVGEQGMQLLIRCCADPETVAPLPDITLLGMLLPGVAMVLYLVGMVAYRRSYVRDGPVADGYLAVALLIAAFAEVHFAIYPATYTALVTTQDALRVAFFLVLLLGINAESRSDLRALRSAYAAMDRLRQSEAERATLEERTRLARELHDGLAQDLWFAKLKHERLVSMVPDDARPLAAEVTQALDSAIAEAKQAVVTMRAGERDEPLPELLGQIVDDFSARSGLRSEVQFADLPSAPLPPRTQAEVLRILQEALTNVRKHADATVVRVGAEVENGRLRLHVADNGRGFRPDESSGDGLGLQGMKERARLMGGELRVISEPSGGTEVELSVPIGGGNGGAGGPGK
ncbi:MAG TPA: sensor histidine kinase [Candidatus Limnocylindrales bacterium]|nr:sensor histidine kinase [Candidatus Limnocylindrales bacterium]